MSWSLLDMPFRGAQYLTSTLPQSMADVSKTYAGIPLIEAQTATERQQPDVLRSQAELNRAQVPYYGSLTNKTAIEAGINEFVLGKMRGGGRGAPTGGYTLPSDEGGTTPSDQGGGGGGGGGGNIGPGTPDGSGGTTKELMAYAPPRPAPGPNATMLAAAGPQPQLGFGGVTAGSPLMMGATTTQPVSPGVASALGDPNALVADPDTGQMVPKAQYLASHPQTQTQPPPPPPAPTPLAPAAPVQVAQAGPPGAAPAPGGSAGLRRAAAAGERSQPGEYFAPLGVTVPHELADSYWIAVGRGGNPVEALEHIRQVRNNTLLQLAYGGGTPETWKKSVEQAYLGGFLDVDHYRQLHTHPELWMDTIRQLQDPKTTAEQDQRMRDQGMSYSRIAHSYAWDPILHAGAAPEEAGYQKNADGTYTPLMLTPNERAARAGVPIMGGPTGPLEGGGRGQPPVPGAPAPGAQTTPRAPGTPQSPFDAYTAAVRTHEGTSPTMGHYGWIPSTKVAMARQYAPDAVKGMSDTQIVAAQLPPDAEEKMMQGFTANNAVELGKAGLRASGANLGMAHYIGAGSVKNLATVPPDMTMTEMERRGLLAPGSVKNNVELQGNTTARGFIQWAQKKYGNTTLTADDISGATKVAGPGVPTTPPAATPPAATPPAPGQYQGKPQLPPGTPEINVHNIGTDNKAVDGANDAAFSAQGQQRTVQDMLDRTPRLKEAGAFGYGAEFRTNASSLFHQLIKGLSPGGQSDLLKKFDSWNFENQTDREAFIKEATNLAIQQEAALPGVRSGIGIATLVGKGSPSLNMQGDTVTELLNRMLVGHMMTQDYANGLNDAVSLKQQNIDLNTQRYDPVQREYDKDWTGSKGLHNPNVYLGAASLLTDGGKSNDWKKRLDEKQQVEAVKLARRANPDWVPLGGQ